MRVLFVFFFLLLSTQALRAQQPSRQELENRRSALLKEIAATQDQLAATRKDRKATVGQLRALNSKLKARETLIGTINSELGNINSSIHSLNNDILVMNKNLAILKMRYAESVRYAYKNRTSQSLILFLFSADNFNDAIRRMQYLKKYRDYRKTQADNIRQAQEKLSRKITALNSNKKDKASLLQSEEVQKSKIQQEQVETDKVVQELKGREGELMDQIRKNQKIAGKIQSAIKAEIQREIEIARKQAEEEARKKAAEAARQKAAADLAKKQAEEAARQQANNGGAYKAGNQTVGLNTGTNPSSSGASSSASSKPGGANAGASTNNNEAKKPSEKAVATTTSPSYKLSLTPEVQALSNSFAANKGSLPWPVTSGYISSPYGRHPHPVYQNVMIENNGIDIATSAHAPVRAVFSGTVIKVTNINGYVVMISHGEYFTVYTNLASVSVSAGMKVSTKQVIGTAGENSDGESMINFQIWKVGSNNNSSTVDPSGWIAR